MSETQFDVLGIGNAIVDIIAECDDAMLDELGLAKGHMQLIDADQADQLYGKMGPGVEASGGSVANTCAGLASFGAKTAFVGKVADDQFGKVFAHDINSIGVHYHNQPVHSTTPTARCLILVTPDGERTMSTYLGVSTELGDANITEDIVRTAKLIYMEGYLFDKPEAKSAFYKAAAFANDAGRKVALSLSDAFCVERHRAAFQDLIEERIDILFANNEEILAIYETETLEQAIDKVRASCDITAVTLGADGSLIVTRDDIIEIPPVPTQTVKDTTGAGDQYAAGFLYGYANALPLQTCGALASLAASEVISHIGARPQVNLQKLAQDNAMIA
ncbi:MAG: adenosine kinase [Pseudomonadota bacterium]